MSAVDTLSPSRPITEADAKTANDEVKWNGWGPAGKYFALGTEGPNKGQIYLSTDPGHALPKMLPFIQNNLLKSNSPLREVPSVKAEDIVLREATINQAFLAALKLAGITPAQVNSTHYHRLTHCYGRSHRDMLRLRRGIVHNAPDAIIYPGGESDIVAIVKAANEHEVALTPYGGGTNIVGAVETTPTHPDRMHVTLDMRTMNRVLSIDARAQTAVIECGILGPKLERDLNAAGFSLGHDPDSFEHSTLGGWLAARSSGMQSDEYGDIDRMCLSLNMATPAGLINTGPAVPRSGTGPELREVAIGSEGTLGVITIATMKIHPVPAVRRFEAFLFPTWADGLRAVEEAVKSRCKPSMMRLYDAEETELSFAMKPKANTVEGIMSSVVKQYLASVRGFNHKETCLSIVGFEGKDDATVMAARGRLLECWNKHKVFVAGTSGGQSWFAKRYNMPLFRDWANQYNMWVDVSETSANWPQVMAVWRDVKKNVLRAFEKQGVLGWCGCHLSHSYETGCCLYFHFASSVKGDARDNDIYFAAKAAAMEAIIRSGGTASHHHGVGYEHIPWMSSNYNKAYLELMRGIKAHSDPKGIMNPGKLLPEKDVVGEDDGPTNRKHRFYQLGMEPGARM